MPKKVRTLALLALLIVLTACSPQIDGGLIVNKRYHAAWLQMVTVCSGSNPPICTTTPINHPESWSFDVWTGSEEDPHGWVSVSRTTYESFDIGDYWSRGE